MNVRIKKIPNMFKDSYEDDLEPWPDEIEYLNRGADREL